MRDRGVKATFHSKKNLSEESQRGDVHLACLKTFQSHDHAHDQTFQCTATFLFPGEDLITITGVLISNPDVMKSVGRGTVTGGNGRYAGSIGSVVTMNVVEGVDVLAEFKFEFTGGDDIEFSL
jgi:hypothetical protein